MGQVRIKFTNLRISSASSSLEEGALPKLSSEPQTMESIIKIGALVLYKAVIDTVKLRKIEAADKNTHFPKLSHRNQAHPFSARDERL